MDIQEEKEDFERLERLAKTGTTTKLDAKSAESFCNAADVSRLKQENAAKDRQIAKLKSEVRRLQKCRDECKIDCLLEKYNQAQKQIHTLKAEKKRAEKALELACQYHRYFDDFKTVQTEIDFFNQQASEVLT